MYQIHFVTDKEFESLPGKDMESKVGVAYPDHGQAYVRQSGSNAIDVFSAMHELEHLKGNDLDEHFDSENGCYYKNDSWLLPALAGASFLIPGVGPAIGGALSSIGGGIGAGLGAIPGIGGALQGAASTIGTGLSGIGSAYAGAGKAAQSALGIGGGAASGAASGGGGGLSSFGVPSVASGGEEAASLGGALGPGPLATPAISGGAGAGVGGGIGGALSKGLGMVKPGMNAMGMANLGMQGANALGIGQKPQQPQMPDFGSIMSQFNSSQQMPQAAPPNIIQSGNAGNGSNAGYYSGRQPGFMQGVA